MRMEQWYDLCFTYFIFFMMGIFLHQMDWYYFGSGLVLGLGGYFMMISIFGTFFED